MTDTLKGLGYLSDPDDDRDLLWREAVQPDRLEIPATFMLDELGPVLDQGQTPECVAYSGTSQKFWAEYKQHGQFYNFDPDWLYKQCKAIDGSPTSDGTFIRIALQVMQQTGHLAHPGDGLTSDTYFKVDNYARLTSLQQIKEAIITMGPVWFGIQVDNGIFNPVNGIVAEPTGQSVGGHAMLIVGYDDTKQCAGSVGAFRVKNSWGESYAEGGFMWLPYSWFNKYSDWDGWKTVDANDILTPTPSPAPIPAPTPDPTPTPAPTPTPIPATKRRCRCQCSACKNCEGYTTKVKTKVTSLWNKIKTKRI